MGFKISTLLSSIVERIHSLESVADIVLEDCLCSIANQLAGIGVRTLPENRVGLPPNVQAGTRIPNTAGVRKNVCIDTLRN